MRATTPAIGLSGQIVDLTPVIDDAAFIAECRRLLTDRDGAVRPGDRLFGINRERWEQWLPQSSCQQRER